MNPNLRSLVTNRNFMMLWFAYGISAVGDHLSEMAILASQNALAEGVDITPMQARMTLIFTLPLFVLSPIAGAVADRLPRRSVMIVADLCRAVIMGAFMLLITSSTRMFGEDWGPFLPIALVGTFAAFFAPARQAMVPTLVARERLVSANALISVLGLMATVLAAVVSGPLADAGRIATLFWLNAVTFSLSAACVFAIRLPRSADALSGDATAVGVGHDLRTGGGGSEPFFKSLASGVRYIRGHRRVLELIAVAVTFWAGAATVRNVLPAIVKHAYEGNFTSVADFLACTMLGMAVGCVVLSVLGEAVRSEWAIMWCSFGAALAVTLLSVTSWVGLPPEVAKVFGVVALFGTGFFGAGVLVSYNALIQAIVPNRYRGRVYGVNNLATDGGMLLATGVLAIPQWPGLDRWAPPILLLVGGMFTTVGVVSLVKVRRRSTLPLVYAWARGMLHVVSRYWWGLKRVGYPTVPRTGPVIITANHESYIDPLLIYSCVEYRVLSFMIAAEYYNLPVAGYFIKVAHCIPVRRGEHDIQAVKTAIRMLREGRVVGVFIQGGIQRGGGEGELKNGVAMMALRTGATVVPVHISGMRPAKGIVATLLRRHDTRVAFGAPVDLSDLPAADRQQKLDCATERIFAAIQSLSPHDVVG